ncbi:MAG: hypothetical protein PHP86_14650 [Nevskiales bacterium]|nr:hypothetical protein [Nevskiales bacterium]
MTSSWKTRLGGLLLIFSSMAASGHGGHAGPGEGTPPKQPYFKGIRGDYRADEARWWKGNTHTHTWWSDGDSPPETAAAWYREHGYQFLVLSDHNRMQAGAIARGNLALHYTQWYPIEDEARAAALAIYREHFGPDWVEERVVDGVTQVRLKALDEFRGLFEAPGEFTFVPGEEITDRFESHPIHVNAVNIQDPIAPRGGETPTAIIQNTLNAVLDHGLSSGREVLAHLNHPNFRYALTVEDLVPLRYRTGEGFFELYNGHHGVENYGDGEHPGIERMWDILLAKRIAEGDGTIPYGIANDDAHRFTTWRVGKDSNPGRGWVMVRARRLTPDSIVAAMKRGDFYASTGVTLGRLERGGDTLALAVDPEPGVDYTIEFIGTRRGAELGAHPREPAPDGRASQRYDDAIGVVLKTVRGTEARYVARGDELYVRARVTSTQPHPNPFRAGDVTMAWTQPLVVAAPQGRTP